MVATPQIGRKLTHKRKERRLVPRAVQQIASTPAQTFAPWSLPPRTTLTGTEWQQTYQEWTQSHTQGLSGLTPDLLRREHLYDEDEQEMLWAR